MAASIKTITLEEPGRFSLGHTPAPARPAAGEALVRVRRVGICGSDIHAFRGRQPFFSYPRILGHELGVEVVEFGPSLPPHSTLSAQGRGEQPPLAPGDRCAVEPYLNCGTCGACRRGKSNCCASLKVLGIHIDGGMRELIVVPAAKLHRSRSLSLEQLALIETLGIGAHAVERAGLERGESVLVIGAGPIGLSVIQFAKLAGVNPVVLDVSEPRLEFCRRQFGVEHTLGAGKDAESTESAAARLVEIFGELPGAVFDATGNAQSMARAFSLVGNGGRLVFVGLVQGEIAFSDPELHRRELTLLATRNSTPETFRRILALMEAGAIDTRPWITHRAGSGEMIDAFPSWVEPHSGCIKAMVEF